MNGSVLRVLRTVGALVALSTATACSAGSDGVSSTSPSSTSNSSSSSSPARGPLELGMTRAFQLPAPVQREVAVGDGSRIYLAGGLDSSGTSTSGVFVVDPTKGTTTPMGTLPQAVHDAAGALLGNRLVVFGGGPTEGTDLVQAFDLGTRSGSVVGHLPVPLSDLTTTEVNGTVYLVGGYEGAGRPEHRAIYSTTNGQAFRTVAELPGQLRYAAVTSVGSRIVIAGGETPTGVSDSLYALDTSTGRLTKAGTLPVGLAHAAAFTALGRVFVVGGQDAAGQTLRTVFRIDPRDWSIKQVARMTWVGRSGRARRVSGLPHPVSDAGVVSAGQAWLIGGWNGHSTTDVVLRAVFGPRPSG